MFIIIIHSHVSHNYSKIALFVNEKIYYISAEFVFNLIKQLLNKGFLNMVVLKSVFWKKYSENLLLQIEYKYTHLGQPLF